MATATPKSATANPAPIRAKAWFTDEEKEYLTNIAVDLAVLVDREAGERWVREIYYGDPDLDVELPWNEWATVYFQSLQPRKGVLGLLRDFSRDGGRITFFSNTDSPVVATAAEVWLRRWMNQPFLNLNRMDRLIGEHQLWMLSEGHTYSDQLTDARVLVVRAGALNTTAILKAMEVQA